MFRRQLVALAALLLSLVPAGGALAQSASRCFPETGYCISGPIRAYWERNGGLAVFGYPIGPQQQERVEDWVGPVQWFQRDRLEDHSGEGYGVLAGRLGAEVLERQGRPWQYGSEQPIARPAGICRFFSETGYNMCPPFSDYWRKNGGLERFGYPITPVVVEMIEGRPYHVQYFERRRMELHLENKPPYDVLLGLLGTDARAYGPPPPHACSVPVLQELQANYQDFSGDSPLGCPVAGQDFSFVQGSAARFERGAMYWINLRGGRSAVLVLTYEASGRISYRLLDDTWRAGDPVSSGLTPPAGLYEPSRGFGKIWRENPDIRSALGWALEAERATTVSFQQFELGSLLRVTEENLVWRLDQGFSARSSVIKY